MQQILTCNSEVKAPGGSVPGFGTHEPEGISETLPQDETYRLSLGVSGQPPEWQTIHPTSFSRLPLLALDTRDNGGSLAFRNEHEWQR
jgi:hypothetical protein